MSGAEQEVADQVVNLSDVVQSFIEATQAYMDKFNGLLSAGQLTQAFTDKIAPFNNQINDAQTLIVQTVRSLGEAFNE